MSQFIYNVPTGNILVYGENEEDSLFLKLLSPNGEMLDSHSCLSRAELAEWLEEAARLEAQVLQDDPQPSYRALIELKGNAARLRKGWQLLDQDME